MQDVGHESEMGVSKTTRDLLKDEYKALSSQRN